MNVPYEGEAAEAVQSFEIFFAQHAEEVQRWIAVTIGDADLAADAAAEAMAKAFSRWSKVATFENPQGWVYRVGVNWAKKRFIRQRRDAQRFGAWLGERPDHSELVEEGGLGELAETLGLLPLKQREILVLRYVVGFSTAETARLLGVAEGTVQSRTSRAAARLRQQLERGPKR